MMERNLWVEIGTYFGIALVVGIPVSLGVTSCVERVDRPKVEACESIGAKPFYTRTRVDACEMPDGTLVAIPSTEASP